ncbi:MAG: thioredoxin reductase (NADPH) [Planctomycetota bacterium]|jgi:thioredoxin reductase (NADPH)
MSSPREVIIIGSGPAGYTAAIYAARANLKPLMIDGMQPGGQLTITTDVENYPGYPEGVMGPKMMEDFRAQAERFGTEFVMGQVIEIDFSQRPFKLKTDFEEFEAKSIIICTGASARLLGLDKEKEIMGRGLSACATCDGAFFPDKELVIIGGGDSAMEEANYLTRYATKVTIIHRREVFRASPIMLDRARANKKNTFLLNKTPIAYLTDDTGKLSGVQLEDTLTGEKSDFNCDGLFIAIGHVPNSGIFKGQIDLDDDGYITVKNGTETNIEGVFAAGDIADKEYRQAVTAAGMGCMAAIDCERWLDAQEG